MNSPLCAHNLLWQTLCCGCRGSSCLRQVVLLKDSSSVTTSTHGIALTIVWFCAGTIFAYGQTNSGKTFTMSGEVNGIIPLSCVYLFDQVEVRQLHYVWRVHLLCCCTLIIEAAKREKKSSFVCLTWRFTMRCVCVCARVCLSLFVMWCFHMNL